jgi:phosphonate transport system substrate-binding protein
MEKKIQDQLRILWKSPGYTPHAVTVHPRVDSSIAGGIQKALLTMHTAEKGKAALQNIRIKGFTIAKDTDWDDVRSLNINYLDKLTK